LNFPSSRTYHRTTTNKIRQLIETDFKEFQEHEEKKRVQRRKAEQDMQRMTMTTRIRFFADNEIAPPRGSCPPDVHLQIPSFPHQRGHDINTQPMIPS
jgi:hypothetical protein